MNNLKKLLPLLTFILGIGLVFTQSAFTTNQKSLTRLENNKMTIQNWYFNPGEPLSNAKNEIYYGTAVSENCDSEKEVPCRISFESDAYLMPISNTPLQNYLNAHPTVADVLNDAKEVRSE